MLSFLTYSEQLIIQLPGAAYSMWQVILIGISTSDRKKQTNEKANKNKNVNGS